MKNGIIGLIIGIIVGLLIYHIWLCKCDSKIVEVPVTIEVPVPVVEKEFDTIYYPQPIAVEIPNPINSDLKDKLDNATSQLDSLKALKEFAVKRNYKEVFEDSIQTITVDAETTGTLDKLKATYKTKPRTIKVDTIIPVEVPLKAKFSVGGELILPDTKSLLKPSIKPEIGFDNKKGNLQFSIGRDFFNDFTTVGAKFKF